MLTAMSQYLGKADTFSTTYVSLSYKVMKNLAILLHYFRDDTLRPQETEFIESLMFASTPDLVNVSEDVIEAHLQKLHNDPINFHVRQ